MVKLLQLSKNIQANYVFLKKDAKTPNPLSAILSENNLPNTVSP